MELMTIKEFAENQLVSYEAIRRQTITYKEELKGHIIRKGRTQYLDSYAIEFLKQKRKDNPIVTDRKDYQAEIDQLQEQISLMKDKLLKLHEELLLSKQENISLIEYKGRTELLIEMRQQDQKQLEEKEKELQAAEQANREKEKQIESLQAEANSYVKSWFGFYKKIV